MKKTIVLLALIGNMLTFNLNAQLTSKPSKLKTHVSIGMVINSNDTETVWNALRLANYAKSEGDTVCIFLLGKGVELDNLVKENKDVKEQSELFLNNGGSILGCGTCLRSRKNNAPQVCKISSLKDLYELIRKSKIVLTF
jgi:uncharacterized protein involved in oxidation of intracellular sulfur